MSDSISEFLVEKYGVAFFLVVILALAIIAILHFGVKFDINAYITSRKERHRKLAQSYCPHMDFIPRGDNSFQVKSLFYTPFGTPTGFALDAEPYYLMSPIKRNLKLRQPIFSIIQKLTKS